MAVDRINRSQRFRDSVWLYYANDPSERMKQYIVRWGGRASFPFRLSKCAPFSQPDIAFTFTLLPGLVERERSFSFSWRHASGIPLPSLLGTITVSRFGPFINLLVSAEYAYGDDPASRLLHEAIGERCALSSMHCLLQLLRSIFPTAQLGRRAA